MQLVPPQSILAIAVDNLITDAHSTLWPDMRWDVTKPDRRAVAVDVTVQMISEVLSRAAKIEEDMKAREFAKRLDHYGTADIVSYNDNDTQKKDDT